MSKSAGYLYQYLPWNFITKFHEGVVIQKDGILQRTFAYRAPDTASSSDIAINALSIRVSDFAKRLGAGWAFSLEAQRFYTQDYPRSGFDLLAPYLIDREREASFKSAGKHFESSYYLTFTWKPPSETVKKLTDMFIQGGSQDAGKGAGVKQNVDYFVNETDSVAALLANNMFLAPLNNEETIAYLHSSVSFNRHWIRFPYTQILLDRVLPDQELLNSFPMMKLGEYHIPIVSVNDFPEESYPTILDALNEALIEYRWVTRYICLEKEESKKLARKREKAHRGSRKTFLQLLSETTSGEAAKSENHGAGVKEEDSIAAGIEIENDLASMGYLTTCVCVWDKNKKLAGMKADAVKTIINSSGFTSFIDSLNSFQSWKSMMPGDVYSNYRALPVMSYTLSHLVPLSSVWAGMRRNDHAGCVTGVDAPHLVCSTDEGTPFYLNLNPSDVGHCSVFGPTGGGKSTLLSVLAMQFFKYPDSQVIAFDKDKSCRQPCLAAGGLFYEPAAENTAGISFQPLRDLESDQDILNAGDFIEACITVNGNRASPAMRAAIKNTLLLLREKPVKNRTLTSFIQYSADYQDPETKKPVFKDYLRDYLWDGGKYGKIFDSRGSSISLESRYTAFEMGALMNRGDNCVVPALVYLFGLVEKKFDGRLTLLVLDEAWLFLKHESFADKIAEWLKVLRKKNVFVVFATQNVSDVAESPLFTTIIQQCLTKIYLADNSAASNAMAPVYAGFGLTDEEISLIAASEMKKHYFYTSPLGRRLFQLDLGPLTLSLVGAPDHAFLDKLAGEYAQGSSFCSAILRDKGVDYLHYVKGDAPAEPEPLKRTAAPAIPDFAPAASSQPENTDETTDNAATDGLTSEQDALFEAILSAPGRKRSDGGGRAAEALAKRFSVSESTVYQARSVLKSGRQELVDAMRQGRIPIKTAYKRLKTG